MRKTTKGRLFAIFAASTLVTSPVMSTAAIAVYQPATPEQTQAYGLAVKAGPDALIAFIHAFPNSPLIPRVIKALAKAIGVENAVQAALDAGVDTEVVFAVAAEIAPRLFTATGQASGHANSHDTSHANVNSELRGPY